MNGRTFSGWKLAALPLAAGTAVLALGINYFVGGRQERPTSAPEDFKFETGAKYAPGMGPASQAGAQGGSSIEMFKKVNENYSKETAGTVPKSAAKPKTKKELAEFMRQVHHDINYDPAAMAPSGGQNASLQGQGGSINNYSMAGGGKNQSAAQTAAGAKTAGAMPRLKTAGTGLSSGKSSFAAGFSGSSSARGGAGAVRSRGVDAGSEGQTGSYGSGNQGSGEGRDLSAGEYGSHGGGSSNVAAPSGEAGAAGSMKQAAQEEKPVPAPVSYIWPRSFDFGDMYAYESAARQVIVMNIGDATLALGKIENMDGETPFFLEKDKCSSAKLAPGKSCTFRVRFSPQAVKEYYSGFSIDTNDAGAMNYQSYIEVKGNAKYSYWTRAWINRWGSAGAGYANRLDFGMVPEGYSMDEVLRVTNNSGSNWHSIKLDRSKLPASFKLAGDGCTGKDLAPHQSCPVTVNFVPDAASNRQFSTSSYGLYSAVNIENGSKLYSARPHFPPLVIDAPVEAAPRGELRVLADYDERYNNRQLVLSVPIAAKSCAPFPVTGLVRLQHYYYFK